MNRPQARNSLLYHNVIAFIAALGLATLNVARILKVPVTFDEALSYDLRGLSYTDIIRYNQAITANNHMLNSVLVKFFTSVFNGGAFWVRFDSLLAQIVYLLFSCLVARKLFKPPGWWLCLYLALNLQPFLFEFWGLGRGYGLSLAFMAASVYYLVCYAQTGNTLWMWFSLGCAVLATCSNFTLLNYYCGLVCAVVFSSFLRGRALRTKTQIAADIAALAIASGGLALLVWAPLRKLAREKQLYFGGERNNIVDDTVNSLLSDDLHLGDPKYSTLLYGLAVCIITIVVIASVYYLRNWLRKKDSTDWQTGMMLWLLFIVPASSIIVQHVVFGTPYPVQRTALYFIPLFLLMGVYFLFAATAGRAAYGRGILYVFTGLFLCNFVVHANTCKTTTWWLDEHNTVVMERIANEQVNHPGKVNICVDWVFVSALHYYATTKYSRYIGLVSDIRDRTPGCDTAFDYYYVSRDDRKTLPPIYIVDTAFYDGWYVLMRKGVVK